MKLRFLHFSTELKSVSRVSTGARFAPSSIAKAAASVALSQRKEKGKLFSGLIE